MKLNMNASAVLAWLPEGETATANSFDPGMAEPPPNPNPEPWWYLEDAIARFFALISSRPSDSCF